MSAFADVAGSFQRSYNPCGLANPILVESDP